MIKFPELDKVFIQFKDCEQKSKKWYCPRCKTHKQCEWIGDIDCKEIIYDNELSPDGKLQGGNTQCSCVSKEHN